MSKRPFDRRQKRKSRDESCNSVYSKTVNSLTYISDDNNTEDEYNEVNEGILCSANFEELKNAMMDICDKGLWDGNLRIGPNQEGIKYILMNCVTEYECRIRHQIDLFNPRINSEEIMNDLNILKMNISKIVNAVDQLDQLLFPDDLDSNKDD